MLSRNPRSIASFSSIFLDMSFFQNLTRFAGVLNKSNNSNESNKSYTLRGALLISSMIGCAQHSIQASYGKSQIFYVKRYKFDYYLVIS